MLARKFASKTDYILRLSRGEDVVSTIITFCKKENIRSGSFRAIGAVENANVGYYDLAAKRYGSKIYAEPMEVASMMGNIALVDGEPFVHVHAVLSGIAAGTENTAIGGHLFGATVAVTLEVHLEAFSEPIERVMDESIGLKLLDLDAFECEAASLSPKMVE